MTKLSQEPTLCAAWVGMHRHMTSHNQGTFLRKREDPGNEVGNIVIHTVDKKVHFDFVHIFSKAHAVLVNMLLSLIQDDL